jgi:hypothetical protein
MIGVQSAYAETDYQAGFRHGVDDGILQKNIVCRSNGCDPVDLYILQPGHTFANHSLEFDVGYANGWCSIMKIGGMDEDEATFDCQEGPSSVRP